MVFKLSGVWGWERTIREPLKTWGKDDLVLPWVLLCVW